MFARTPFLHDLPLMHFIAWRVGEGDQPYVDLGDMNGPATYMLHHLMLAIPLPASLTASLMMTALTFASAFSAAAIARRSGMPWLDFAAGLCTAVWIASQGNELLMQRDMLIATSALVALALVTKPGAAQWRWAVAALLIGLSVGVKPTAIPFAMIMLAGALAIDLSEGRTSRRTMAVVIAGICGGALWFGYLLWTGSLGAWWSIMAGYNADYVTIARQPFLALAGNPVVLFAFMAALAVAAMFVVRLRGRATREHLTGLAMAAAFAATGAAVFVMQGKGWAYQAAPAGLLGIGAVAAILASAGPLSRTHAIAAATLAMMFGAFCIGGIREQLSPGYAARQEQRLAFVGDMRSALAALPPGMKVQPLDTTDGALHAMLEARRSQASPVLYDFWLFTGSDAGQAKARADVLAALHGGAAVLITDQGWPGEGVGFARMQELKEFQTILAANYTLASEGRRGRYGYRLFAPAQ